MADTFERDPRRPPWAGVAALGLVAVGLAFVAFGSVRDGSDEAQDGLAIDREGPGEDGGGAEPLDGPQGEPGDEEPTDAERVPDEVLPPDGEGPPADEPDDAREAPEQAAVLPGGTTGVLFALTVENTLVELDLATGDRRESEPLDHGPFDDPTRMWVTDELVLLIDPRHGHLHSYPRSFDGQLTNLSEGLEGEARNVLSSPDGTSAWVVIGEPLPDTQGGQEVRPVGADGLGEPEDVVDSPFHVYGTVEGGFVISGPSGASYRSVDGNVQHWQALSPLVSRRGVTLLRRCFPETGCELWRARGPAPEPVNIEDEDARTILGLRGGLQVEVSADGSRASLHHPGVQLQGDAETMVIDLDSGTVLATVDDPPEVPFGTAVWSPDGAWLLGLDPLSPGSVLGWAPDDDTQVTLPVADSRLRAMEVVGQ